MSFGPSLRMGLLALVFYGFCVANAVWMIGLQSPILRIFGWATIPFCVIGVASFVPGIGELRLDAEGFTVRTLLRRWRVRWHRVASIEHERIGGLRYVLFDYVPDDGKPGLRRRLSLLTSGCDGSFINYYAVPTERLVALMEDRRAAAIGGE